MPENPAYLCRQPMRTAILALLSLAPLVCPAATFYSNTTTDIGDSAVYSAMGVTQIGDQLQLTNGGTLTSVSTQFYNLGADATFDAVLRIFETGAPVGNPLGGPFTLSNLFIAANTSLTVTFSSLGGLAVPQDIVAMVAVDNVTAGGDLGLNYFDPPLTGTSSNTFFLTFDGSTFAQASTLNDYDNLYFEVTGTTGVPEPGTAALTLLSLAVLAWRRTRN